VVDALGCAQLTKVSLSGQWDAVNGEVLRCPAVQTSMDHDHQLERHMISDFKLQMASFMNLSRGLV